MACKIVKKEFNGLDSLNQMMRWAEEQEGEIKSIHLVSGGFVGNGIWEVEIERCDDLFTKEDKWGKKTNWGEGKEEEKEFTESDYLHSIGYGED